MTTEPTAPDAGPVQPPARHRRGLLPAAAVLTVTATVAGLVAPSWGVADTPQKALQAVQVRMSPTGALTGMTSTLIERTATSYTSHSSSLDPAAEASHLPVRVTTGYLLNGHPGTDLSRLSGASGTVEIDVTVANATLRPERVLQRDLDGVPSSSYALVATPLTVVAQADLPAGSARSVVTKPVTNGVLTTSGASGDVVWSALLAPPQLSPTTTFRLVEQTSHFVMPTFHITVQPGVQTDPSLAHLLGASLSRRGSSDLVAVQNAALMLVDRIDGKLSRVTTDLMTISRNLQQQADQIGPQATAQLRSADGDIRGSIGGLESDLTSLDGKVSSSLQANTGKADSTIAGVIQQIDQRLGVAANGFPTSPPSPVTPTASPSPQATGCAAAQPGKPQLPGSTLIGQLEAISGQVAALAGSTGACQDALAKVLQQEIGTPGDSCSGSTTLLCGLDSVATQSQALYTSLQGNAINQAIAALDSTATQDLDSDTSDLATRLQAVQTAYGELSGSLNSLNLTDLLTALSNAGDAVTKLDGDISALHTLAAGQVAAIQDSGSGPQTSRGVASEVSDLADAICSTDPAGAAALLPLLEGKTATCSNGKAQAGDGTPADGYQTSIDDFVTQDLSAWQNVASQTGDSGALAGDVSDITTALGQIFGSVPTGGHVSDLPQALSDLQSALGQLTSGPGAPDCSQSAASLAALQRLQCDLTSFESGEKTAHDDLATAIGQLRGTAQSNANAAASLETTATTAESKATGDFDQLLGGLSTAAQKSAGRILRAGGRIIGNQESRLAGTRRIEGRRLTQATRAAISKLASSFGSAHRDESVAATQLTGEIRDVISNLGAPSGSGLLGTVASAAQLAAARNADVRQAGSTGLAYSTVGQAAIDQDLLQRAQLAQGLNQAANFSPLGAPPGVASSTTVFVFTIGGAA